MMGQWDNETMGKWENEKMRKWDDEKKSHILIVSKSHSQKKEDDGMMGQ